LSAQATNQFEELPVGLVFRSVGYRGVALPDIPFNDKWGVVLNERGRILDSHTKQPLPGLYTAGWIKRGPSGVIGTNKPDSVETVIVEVAEPNGPFGARGLGELPFLPLAPAIAAAVHDATGVWFDEFPLAPERVLRGLGKF
jgi:NADPH-dependent glutamate synthase beta subunit-like oxidoreductase